MDAGFSAFVPKWEEKLKTNTQPRKTMNPRNGKIARLPREIRDELNERLEQSEESPQLLGWLNALPEVREVVQSRFAGALISKQNLSEWRQGGFQEWLARRDLVEEARDVAQCADEMDECSDGMLADAAATVLAARFGGLIAHWDGEVDAKFEAKSRVLNRLCRSVVQLQRGMHRACRENFELRKLQEEKEKAEVEAFKERLVTPWMDALRLPAMAKIFGGGAKGEKIAEYIMSIQRGKFDAELRISPSDDFEQKKSVKPPRKQRTGKRTGKTQPNNADKPLEDNEIEGETEEESNPGQSGSVKPNQTDLTPNVADLSAMAAAATAETFAIEERNSTTDATDKTR